MRLPLFPRILCLLGLLCLFAGAASAQNIIEGRADSISLRAFGTESVRLFQASEQRRVRLSAWANHWHQGRSQCQTDRRNRQVSIHR